jgi:hypothetical protein
MSLTESATETRKQAERRVQGIPLFETALDRPIQDIYSRGCHENTNTCQSTDTGIVPTLKSQLFNDRLIE